MTSFFGANWRTTVTGLLETLCLIAIALCSLPSDVWSNPKVWVPSVVLLVAKTFKDFITKDKTVTGGTVQNDPPALTSNSPAIQKTPLIVIFLALGLGFTLSACGTNSLFEGASTAKAGDGKIPVQVVASAGATGNTDSSTVNYDGGVKVVFGLGVTPAERSDIITRAKTLGVPVIAASDASLGRAAHFHFGHKLSKEKRDAFKHRFGL